MKAFANNSSSKYFSSELFERVSVDKYILSAWQEYKLFEQRGHVW